jgi:hypothetical protein
MKTWDQVKANSFTSAFQTIVTLPTNTRQQLLSVVLATLNSSKDQLSYEETKYLINAIFNMNKTSLPFAEMGLFDSFLQYQLAKFNENVKQDWFSLLHLVIMMLKVNSDPRIRYQLRGTIQSLLKLIAASDFT